MRRYQLSRRSGDRILLRSEHPDDTDPLLKMDSSKTAVSGSVAAVCPFAVENRIRKARAWIKFSIMGIWVWYVVVWIAVPTYYYKTRWRPFARDMTNTIYFGIQGTNMLIFILPVLLAAVLGCIYLHLGKRLNNNRLQEKHRRSVNKKVLSSWKRPFLTKGPLGIVSQMELALLVIFLILLIWSYTNYLLRDLKRLTSAKPGLEKRSLIFLKPLSVWLALIGNTSLTLLFFPVTRGSSILPLFGLTSESSVRYHIWLGHIAMSLFAAHGVLFLFLWAINNEWEQMLKWDKFEESNLAGEISLLAGVIMWLATFPRIRKKMFELFFYTHHLYIVVVVFFIFHIGIGFACMMLPGFYLFVIDRYLRLLQSQRKVTLVSSRLLPCQSIELNFAKSKGLNYSPASIMFLNVPSISKLQWHPFTVCSNSDLEPDNLSVMIKSEGSWSQKLYQMLSEHPSIEHLDVSVEGPYGSASTHFLRHDTLLMVSGGSGITPFMSIIRGLIHASSNAQKTPKVVLICAFKSSSDLTMLDLLLPLSAPSPSALTNLDIQIEAYVTREQEPPTLRKKDQSIEGSKTISTIWFKPNKSDAPISATLGPSSWLWLAMIISSSFLMSLLLIAVVTRYHIYPIDKNTNKIYPKSFKSIVYMLSFCISILVTASAAFMWNKRKDAKKEKPVINSVPSPDFTSDSSTNDGELESCPSQSLAEVTSVHYGARPNLNRILSECRGSSVGVFVCGPEKMQQDVAVVCASDSSENLHFELISFSW